MDAYSAVQTAHMMDNYSAARMVDDLAVLTADMWAHMKVAQTADCWAVTREHSWADVLAPMKAGCWVAMSADHLGSEKVDEKVHTRVHN